MKHILVKHNWADGSLNENDDNCLQNTSCLIAYKGLIKLINNHLIKLFSYVLYNSVQI